VLPEQVNHAQRRLPVAAVGLDEHVNVVTVAEALQNLVQPGDVVLTHRTVGRVPVRDERGPEFLLELMDDLLRLVEQDGGFLKSRAGAGGVVVAVVSLMTSPTLSRVSDLPG
jgi:hypothetical protein